MQNLEYYINEYFGVLKRDELIAVCDKFKAQSLPKGEFLRNKASLHNSYPLSNQA